MRLLPSSAAGSPMQTFCAVAEITGVGDIVIFLLPELLHPSRVVTFSDTLYSPGVVYGRVAFCAEETAPFPKSHFQRALAPTSTVVESLMVSGWPVDAISLRSEIHDRIGADGERSAKGVRNTAAVVFDYHFYFVSAGARIKMWLRFHG